MSKFIDEYGLERDTEDIKKKAYQQGRADAIDEFRTYLKTIELVEMPQDIWNIGVDNTCDRMLKEQNNDTI